MRLSGLRCHRLIRNLFGGTAAPVGDEPFDDPGTAGYS